MIKIYGSSDDLIEIAGVGSKTTAEFYLPRGHDEAYLLFSTGDVFKVWYTDEGVWRITPTYIVGNSSDWWKEYEAVSADDDQYSDIVVLDKNVAWVSVSTELTVETMM